MFALLNQTKMRKVKLQMQLSVDGFVAGLQGEMDWMTWNWDDGLKNYVTDLTDSIDCILLGRNMPGGFIPYWKSVTANPDDPQFAFGKKMDDTLKVVFSKTLKKSEWDNTILAQGDISEEVKALKEMPGKDIIAYGGANFVSSLIRHDLIDEYHLFINPAAIGAGMPIFTTLTQKMSLKLVKATPFDCGIVVLQYEPDNKAKLNPAANL
jgi:dihydrofolate reductase